MEPVFAKGARDKSRDLALIFHQQNMHVGRIIQQRQKSKASPFSVLPRLNSCFFAQIHITVRTHGQTELPGPRFLLERKIGNTRALVRTQSRTNGSNRTHLSFAFLRVSGPPWCKGFVLWLRLRRHITKN
jgi:hypothetical protein